MQRELVEERVALLLLYIKLTIQTIWYIWKRRRNFRFHS